MLKETPPDPVKTGLRLLVVRNMTERSNIKFPMKKETLQILLNQWDFPPLDEILYALHAGGSAVFKPCSSDAKRISMA